MPYDPRSKKHLTLIQGGESAMGPVERLGWRDHAPVLSSRQIAFLIAGKAILLASVLYFLWH